MPDLIAMVRDVSPRLAECELSYQQRERIDLNEAIRQHEAYCDALGKLGVNLVKLPPLPGHPDGVFVEDGAVILDEVAILTRPGAESRRTETESVGAAIRAYRPVVTLEAPATLDGGDVLQIGKTLYVGHSQRSNVTGIQQLAQAVAPYGYWVTPIQVIGCLHLKTACTWVGGNAILANRKWLDMEGFCGLEILEVPEPGGANVLRIGETLLMPSAFPETRELLETRGLRVQTLELSELMKAEAGVTCLSLLFRDPGTV